MSEMVRIALLMPVWAVCGLFGLVCLFGILFFGALLYLDLLNG